MGKLYSIGENQYGNLGLGNTTDRSSFTQVGALTTWSKLSAGMEDTFAIKTDGTLWACGRNAWGVLGQGDETQRNSFTQIGALTTWSKIACGGSHALAIKTDGTLWACGGNFYGQLGRGNTTSVKTFTQVGALTTWSKRACGRDFSYAIKTDGTLWSTGHNTEGQLGQGNTTQLTSFTQVGALTTWSNVACGTWHVIATKTNGTLWSAGRNDTGQLGLGDTTNRTSFTQVGALTTWSKIAGNKRDSYVIKTDGTLWGTGFNSFGELGLGDTTQRTSFTQVGVSTGWTDIYAANDADFALAKHGSYLYGAGTNTTYQLALGDTTDRSSFTIIPSIYCDVAACGNGVFDSAYGSTFFISLGASSRHKGNTSSGCVLFNGSQYVGDYANGKIYKLDMNTYTDDGLPIKRVRRTQIINKERLNVIHNKVEVDFEHGVGLSGSGSGSDPQATLKWSDDEGNTWSAGLSVDIGAYQQYDTRAIWRRLGKSRNRIYELTIEEPVKVVITGAYADLKECRF